MTSFDLRSLKLWSGEEYRDEHLIELEPLEFGGQRYVPVPAAVPAELTISRATTGTVFGLRFDSRLHGPCQRCLGDAVVTLPVTASEYEAAGRTSAEELRNPFLTDDRLDLSAWASAAVSLALPDKIVCRADCAGLCPECGADLNENPHTHERAQQDPRWAALSELRDRL